MSKTGSGVTDAELSPLLSAFKKAMDNRFPQGIVDAMQRVSRYGKGERAADVFGASGRDGYHDDCRLIAEYFTTEYVRGNSR